MKNKRIVSILFTFTIAFSSMLPAFSVNAEEFSIRGDVNADCSFDVSDVILLQKWLLSVPDTHLENQRAADLCKDGKLDILDFALMKRELACAKESVNIDFPVCKSAALACIDDKELLYCDNINECIAPASLTKLLTACVALHYLSSDTVITVGSEQNLVKSGSSLCLIKPGHRLKLNDLISGMLMASGNDAAYTVAVTTARAVRPDVSMTDSQAVEYFSELMNEYASSLGIKNSHFVNPDGWDDDSQFTTVSDLLIVANHAFSVSEIKSITGTYRKKVYFVSGENITWTNTNALLNPNGAYYCADAVGMKTGTTQNAGNCLIAAFKCNGKSYLSAVTGCANSNDRYELTLKMLSAYTKSETSAVKTEKNDSESTATDSQHITVNKSVIFERLGNLEYIPVICDGLPEYQLTVEDGAVYWLNLSEKWVWKDGVDAEAKLPDDIIAWLISNKDNIDLNTTKYYELRENNLNKESSILMTAQNHCSTAPVPLSE